MSAVWDTYTRGTAVEYFHVATRSWKPATVEGYSAGMNAYVVRTESGDTDMSSATWTRLAQTTTVQEASRETAKIMDRHAAMVDQVAAERTEADRFIRSVDAS